MLATMPEKPRIRIPTPAQIRSIRETAKLSQAAAALKVGVSTRTWIYWENGERAPSLSRAILIQQIKDGII